MNVKKLIIVLLVVNILLCGCTVTRYIAPTLPTFTPILPERPELLELPAGAEIPEEVNINLILLMGYAEKLEIALDNWELFYNELATIYKNDRAGNGEVSK